MSPPCALEEALYILKAGAACHSSSRMKARAASTSGLVSAIYHALYREHASIVWHASCCGLISYDTAPSRMLEMNAACRMARIRQTFLEAARPMQSWIIEPMDAHHDTPQYGPAVALASEQ